MLTWKEYRDTAIPALKAKGVPQAGLYRALAIGWKKYKAEQQGSGMGAPSMSGGGTQKGDGFLGDILSPVANLFGLGMDGAGQKGGMATPAMSGGGAKGKWKNPSNSDSDYDDFSKSGGTQKGDGFLGDILSPVANLFGLGMDGVGQQGGMATPAMSGGGQDGGSLLNVLWPMSSMFGLGLEGEQKGGGGPMKREHNDRHNPYGRGAPMMTGGGLDAEIEQSGKGIFDFFTNMLGLGIDQQPQSGGGLDDLGPQHGQGLFDFLGGLIGMGVPDPEHSEEHSKRIPEHHKRKVKQMLGQKGEGFGILGSLLSAGMSIFGLGKAIAGGDGANTTDRILSGAKGIGGIGSAMNGIAETGIKAASSMLGMGLGGIDDDQTGGALPSRETLMAIAKSTGPAVRGIMGLLGLHHMSRIARGTYKPYNKVTGALTTAFHGINAISAGKEFGYDNIVGHGIDKLRGMGITEETFKHHLGQNGEGIPRALGALGAVYGKGLFEPYLKGKGCKSQDGCGKKSNTPMDPDAKEAIDKMSYNLPPGKAMRGAGLLGTEEHPDNVPDLHGEGNKVAHLRGGSWYSGIADTAGKLSDSFVKIAENNPKAAVATAAAALAAGTGITMYNAGKRIYKGMKGSGINRVPEMHGGKMQRQMTKKGFCTYQNARDSPCSGQIKTMSHVYGDMHGQGFWDFPADTFFKAFRTGMGIGVNFIPGMGPIAKFVGSTVLGG